MNPIQALALVTQVCEASRLTAAEHAKIQQALKVIRNMISPPPTDKKDETVAP